MCASIVWAFVNDHIGPRSVLRGVSLFALAVPVAALAMPRFAGALGAESHLAYFYAATFLLNGISASGVWMGFTNYVLEIAPESVRPLFLGLSATLSAPAVVAPLLGGLLLGLVSYEVLFGVTCAIALVAFLYVRTLAHPQRLDEPEPAPRATEAREAAATSAPDLH